ncbi:TadE-like protein [Pseudobutyrivibrio sp. OR37]|nr:TadE-like protein [Pseudobutyrivibrio sp. OR37]
MSQFKNDRFPQRLYRLGLLFLFSFVSNKLLFLKSDLPNPNDSKEMPIYASFKRASYTIEAAIIMPLFITLMVFGMFTFRLLQVESGMQKSLDNASRTMAVTLGNVVNKGESEKDVDTTNDPPTIKGELSEGALEIATIGLAGVEVAKNKVPIEFIDFGPVGINFYETNVEGNYIDLKASYTMTFPVGLLGNFKFDVSQRARCRKWVGYDKAENTTDGRYVYITDHGEAYHTNYYCTYLNPSVHRVAGADLSGKRNQGGGVYYPCEKCKPSTAAKTSVYYITDYGTAYHSDINCNKIKHNIKKVLYEEVKDTMRPCSKCAAGEKH